MPRQQASMDNSLKITQLNVIQPSLIGSFTPMFPFSHMSKCHLWKKGQWTNSPQLSSRISLLSHTQAKCINNIEPCALRTPCWKKHLAERSRKNMSTPDVKQESGATPRMSSISLCEPWRMTPPTPHRQEVSQASTHGLSGVKVSLTADLRWPWYSWTARFRYRGYAMTPQRLGFLTSQKTLG